MAGAGLFVERRARLWVVAAVVAGACGDPAKPVPEGADPAAVALAESSSPVAVERLEPLPTLVEDPAEEAAALVAQGALPAWQAVPERHLLLLRRQQEGAVHGRVAGGEDEGGGLWLVDEEEGGGALAIRIVPPAGVEAPEDGDRVVAWGGWDVEEIAGELRWVWRASRLARLPPRDPPARAAGLLEVRAIDAAPEDAVPASEANGDHVILFVVVGAPARFGDPWTIADAKGSPPAARLLLPGEREPYGGQDLTSPAERWELPRDRRLAVRIAPRRRVRASPGELPLLRAVEAPVALATP